MAQRLCQNPINARKGITTFDGFSLLQPYEPGQNPINARKGITTLCFVLIYVGA